MLTRSGSGSDQDWVTMPHGPRIRRAKYDDAMKDRNLRGHLLAIQQPAHAHGPAYVALFRHGWLSTGDGTVEFEY